MSPESIFKDKSVALIVQGILLFSAIIYTTHSGPNLHIVLCITTLLSLYVLQAINHRFRYYFPMQTFFWKNTKREDTYILYALTILSFFFFLMGITHNPILGFILTIIIVAPGPIWYWIMSSKISMDIEIRFRSEDPIVAFCQCPKCGEKAVQVGSFLEGNIVVAVGKCLEGCGINFQKGPKAVRFG